MTFDEFRKEWLSASTYIECRTSGSTSEPKAIRLEKDFVRKSAWRTISFFDLDESSRLHSCVGADFIGGKMMLVRALECGCPFTWEKPSNTPLQGLSGTPISLLAVVPSQMVSILSRPGIHQKLGNIIIGGSPLHSDLRKKITASGLRCFETYGMTETASHIALREVSNNEDAPFIPLPGIRTALDERGCLVINIAGNPPFITNDLAVMNEEGFLIRGRFDNVIITGGKKVNPEMVENKLSPYLGQHFAISSLPDPKWGEAVTLVLEEKPGCIGDMVSHLNLPVLHPHEKPKRIVSIRKIPLTSNGKIDRKALRNLIADSFSN